MLIASYRTRVFPEACVCLSGLDHRNGGVMLALVGRDGLFHAARVGLLYVAGVGRALCVGLAVVAAVGGGLTASVLPAGVGVPAAHGVAALSLLARAWTAAGRVRLRLRLFAVSAAAGGLHHFVVSQPSSASGHSAGVLRCMVQGLGVAG